VKVLPRKDTLVVVSVTTITNPQSGGIRDESICLEGIGSVGFVGKPVPEPRANDAIVKTTKALVCSSDVHTVHGAIGERQNLTLGHEAVGVVETVGSEVKMFKPGDRVVVGAITPDWGDPASQRGHSSQSGGALGGWKYANIKDGVFAEYFHVNEADANMALIPDEVSDEVAAYCTDMMSTGFAGAENADIPLGGTVAVFAQGPGVPMATGWCQASRRRSDNRHRVHPGETKTCQEVRC